MGLDWALQHRMTVDRRQLCAVARPPSAGLGPHLHREFFPEVDAGAFEIDVRAPTGTRIERTEEQLAEVEEFIRETIPEHDLELIISEIGVTPTVVRLHPQRRPDGRRRQGPAQGASQQSAQEYVSLLRHGFADGRPFRRPGVRLRRRRHDPQRHERGQVDADQHPHHRQGPEAALPDRRGASRRDVRQVHGVVDARIIQRLDYPQFTINVDRAKAADLGLTQEDVMKNVVAAFNSSIQFNKQNFWIDPVSRNQYFVGVQYPEEDIESIETLLDIPITGDKQDATVPLRSWPRSTRTTVPTEITHTNIQPTIDLTMGVEGRDLGHVADDVAKVIDKFGKRTPQGDWAPYDPRVKDEQEDPARLEDRHERRVRPDAGHVPQPGLRPDPRLAADLLPDGRARSIVRRAADGHVVVPLSLGGVLPMLYLTGTAINVQSLLGVIFIVGIKVANTVLMTDFAQELRRHEGLSPTEAIRKAASIRVRPVTMTALAAFFAMVPAALAWSAAARRTPRWPAPSSAACSPASRRRCSSCPRSIHSSYPTASWPSPRPSTRSARLMPDL